jgi:hypothetical protein
MPLVLVFLPAGGFILYVISQRAHVITSITSRFSSKAGTPSLSSPASPMSSNATAAGTTAAADTTGTANVATSNGNGNGDEDDEDVLGFGGTSNKDAVNQRINAADGDGIELQQISTEDQSSGTMDAKSIFASPSSSSTTNVGVTRSGTPFLTKQTSMSTLPVVATSSDDA